MKERLEISSGWGEKIIVFGDYDFDGTSSSAILYKTFKELGLNVDCMISTRSRDGYGLSKSAINEIKEGNYDLIITTDCGITQDKEIEYASKLGIDIFVCDHHNRYDEPKFDYIDLAVNQGDFPTSKLSAGGLAFFISKYLIGDKANDYIDLAGFSTIADLVDMTDITNRVLAKFGMKNIKNKGIKALMEVKKIDKLDEGGVGFQIAPCINAVGRLGNNQLSFELFTSDDIKECYKLAEKAHKMNEKRKEMTEKATELVENEVNLSHNIIVHKCKINKGLTGLVAGRLLDKYGRPTIIINEEGKGSGRSLEPLDLQKELQNHLDVIEYASGHSKAFGIGLGDNDIEHLQNRLYEATEGIKYKTIDYEIELNPAVVDDYLLESLEDLKPFGMMFPEVKLIHLADNITDLKELSGGKHLKFKWHGVDCIWFNTNTTELMNSDRLVYTPSYNEFMGRKTIQLMIKGSYII